MKRMQLEELANIDFAKMPTMKKKKLKLPQV